MDNEAQWLRTWGWHVKPQAFFSILNYLSEEDPRSTRPPARDAIVAQLLDSDLKHVGSPSLPEASSLQRISCLQGPLVLQVVSIRNICQNSSKSLVQSGSDRHGRLLRIRLTDGFTTVSAIEYHPMPAFSVDVAPGTKVKLENMISVQNGFLLGDARSFAILGGHVPALYESWEMERKYSGLARVTGTKSSLVEGDSGPPPFHGLHVPKPGKIHSERKPSVVEQSHQQGALSKEVSTSSTLRQKHSQGLPVADMSSSIVQESLSPGRTLASQASSSHQVERKKTLADREGQVERPEDLDARKDAIKAVLALGVETAPLQNREAAQKLLDKRADSQSRKERGRGRAGRGRGRRGERQQEEATITLEEWEAQKGVSTFSKNRAMEDVNTRDDEALAQRLHYELNMERGGIETTGGASSEAERIRLSMFSFADDRGANDESGHGRGRDRGKGRGRGRGRGGRRNR